MATFIALISETQYGEENIYDSVVRAERFKERAERRGIKIKSQYWTMGPYDGVLVLEAPSAQEVSSLLLSLAAGGAVRTQTIQAFDSDEMRSILERSQES
jgi:uncharacterized protein with GYD domain